jgi:dual-specificity kinase
MFCSGLGWSYPCDIWSVGCILVELCTVCYWGLFSFSTNQSQQRPFELPRYCRERHCFKLMRIWSIWLWWRGCLVHCHTTCLRGQSMLLSLIHFSVISSQACEDYLVICAYLFLMCSRHAEKYVRKGRLNWPEGCASRESMKAVMKLPRLQVLPIPRCCHE